MFQSFSYDCLCQNDDDNEHSDDYDDDDNDDNADDDDDNDAHEHEASLQWSHYIVCKSYSDHITKVRSIR